MTLNTFLSCDWGTSNFRLRLVEVDPFRITAEVRLEEGASVVRSRALEKGWDPAEAFREVLERALEDVSALSRGRSEGLPVLISGMASSSIGWKELPYARVPLPLDGGGAHWEELGRIEGRGGAHSVFLFSGIRTDSDVLRGEETEALGLLSDPAYEHFRRRSILLFTGTHSKHLRIEEEAIVDFTTYMTGELFQVLSRHSILRHSVSSGDASASGALKRDAFSRGVLSSRGRALSGVLFSVRTNQLLACLEPAANAAYLSGVLIGAEVLDLAERSPREMPFLLAAGSSLSPSYELAFEVLELSHRLTCVPPEIVERATARGHSLVAASCLSFAQESRGDLKTTNRP